MRTIAPIFTYVKALLMVGLVLGLAACARTPGGGGINGEATPGSQQEFLVTIGDRVFFSTDSSVISAAGQATLSKQAVWLNKYPRFRITIEGHADERGTREYNIALGARRASAVVNFLISRGVSANRISSISYGKERPVAICNDISCWSQNRRAVTVLN